MVTGLNVMRGGDIGQATPKMLSENKLDHVVFIYQCCAKLSKKNLMVFDENERNKDWIEKMENTEYILMNTDLSFSDKRLELIEKVSEWLNN